MAWIWGIARIFRAGLSHSAAYRISEPMNLPLERQSSFLAAEPANSGGGWPPGRGTNLAGILLREAGILLSEEVVGMRYVGSEFKAFAYLNSYRQKL